MNRCYGFSNNTKNYLQIYNCIFENMVRQMSCAELTDSISYNFIVQMIPHHQAAIEMSDNLLQYTTNIPLQEIAEGIIKEQTTSIENMRCIEKCCLKCNNSSYELCLYQKKMDQIMNNMFSNMRCAKLTNQINCNFMWEMIPHHMGAVEMASNTLKYCICSELTDILQAIITSQKKGIAQMQCLLKYINCIGT